MTRTVRAAALAGLAAGLLAATANLPAEKPAVTADKYWVYVGTYTGPKSKGIYRFEFDAGTGKLGGGELAAEAKNPTFLAVHPSHRFLYAVGEFGGPKGGAALAYGLDAKSGKLTALNAESSVGDGPCHISLDRTGKVALVANYGGGSVAALPIKEDGSLGAATSFIQHKGKSADPARQEGPHAHSINVDPSNHFAVAADLGLDRVFVYKLDVARATLTPNEPPYTEVAPGAGPRHFAFHPKAPFGYVINELNSTITAFAWDGDKGTLKAIQTVPTLQAPVKGNSTAEVVVHPSGKFLFGSNRGHNSIVTFAIDEKTGMLTYVAHQGEGIKVPRNFAVDPSGKFLLVANQDGASVIVFRIDLKTGKLEPTDQSVEVEAPVCVRFVPKGA